MVELEKNEIINDEYIILSDKTNLPLARLYIEEIYKPNLDLECEKVLGSNDPNHPYHKYIQRGDDTWYVGGKVEKINNPFHFDFKSIRKSPEQVKNEIKQPRTQ